MCPRLLVSLVLTRHDSQAKGGRCHQHMLALLPLPFRMQDGNPTNWSQDELADILAIWRAVSEDYAPFDVDITTEDPGPTYSKDNFYRIAIGGAFSDCECVWAHHLSLWWRAVHSGLWAAAPPSLWVYGMYDACM